jgi:hypothetical protein
MEQSDKNDNLNKKKETKNFILKTVERISSILLLILLIGALVFVFRFFWLQEKFPSSSSFPKKIRVEIKNAIENGAKLDVVKHIYNNREIEEPKIVKYLFSGLEDFYSESTSLSTILYDIKVDCYRIAPIDSVFIERLGCIIIEHEEINPFDKLESNQKFMFENIRQKLNENYPPIRDDLNRIADEMNNKNTLAGKYLSKSNMSFWISIGAVGITVILGLLQIYLNDRWRHKKKNDDDELEEDTDDNNEHDNEEHTE